MVVDLTRALAGPHAAMMLGDLGARVIKVETPGHGDESRTWGPPFVGPEDSPESTYFLSCNRNKESVTADLRTESGREFLAQLVQESDVLVENFKPGVLERMGFSVARLHELNPGLVILSISGFGHDGPESGRPGYDQIAQGEGGLMSLTGSQQAGPVKVGVPIADLLAGMYGAFGVLGALFERVTTGRGRVVHTSLLAAIVGVHAFQGTRWTVAGEVPEAIGNQHPAIAPYGLFRTGEGTIQIACGTQLHWEGLAALLHIDDPRFATNQSRVEHRDELTAVIEERLRSRTAADWLTALADVHVPAGRVRNLKETYEWEQTRSQGLLITVDHDSLGEIVLPGPALRFDDNPHAGARIVNRPPPTLGQHDIAVRAWLAERHPSYRLRNRSTDTLPRIRTQDAAD